MNVGVTRAYKQYSDEQVKAALDAMDAGMKRNEASYTFGIPGSTLTRLFRKRHASEKPAVFENK